MGIIKKPPIPAGSWRRPIGKASTMGAGITLVVIGAIFAFAVRADGSVVDLQTAGLILMLAGGAVLAHARREKRSSEVLERVEHSSGGDEPETVRETFTRQVVLEDDGTSADQHRPEEYDATNIHEHRAHGYQYGRLGQPRH